MQGRDAALSKDFVGLLSPCIDHSNSESRVVQLHALNLRGNNYGRAFSISGSTTLYAFSNAVSELQELWFGHFELAKLGLSWSDVSTSIPWNKLQRLAIQDPHLQLRLHDVISSLTSLEDLRLTHYRPTAFHANCSYHRPAIYSDVNHPFIDIDFKALQNLKVLKIRGICNHVPIRNLCGPKLQVLSLHKADISYSVIPEESQRSASDLAIVASISPLVETLELDVGPTENLWHPTAIPGVDVDVEQYRFLSALAHFKSLKYLRLFPPYGTREEVHDFTNYRQPVSDDQAIRMFNHIRHQCPKLEAFQMLVSPGTVKTVPNFFPMNWEVRPWGEQTHMTVQATRKFYELRQVWVGDRRLTMNTKKHAYQGKSLSDSDNWLIEEEYVQ